MKSQAYIKIGNESLFVHFENVGRKSYFEKILNRWLTVFPQSTWNETYRAWELPVANFEDVKHFCDKMFGKVSVQPLVLSINQLELKLEGQA